MADDPIVLPPVEQQVEIVIPAEITEVLLVPEAPVEPVGAIVEEPTVVVQPPEETVAVIPVSSGAPGARGAQGPVGASDHGNLTGLTDDDHTLYLKEKASGGLAVETPEHTHASAAEAGTVAHSVLTGVSTDQHHNKSHIHDGLDGSGTVAHSAITGLGVDDHTQYVLRSILTTNGDMFIRAAGVVARLAVGSANQVLGVTAGLPAWQAQTYIDHGSISGLADPDHDHGTSLTGLSDDDHLQYLLLASRTGGQDITGANADRNLTMLGQAADTSNLWGFSTTAAGGGTRLTIVDADAEATNDQALVWIEAQHDGGWPGAGDQSVPIGLYVQHEQVGTGTAFTHSIMALAYNSGTGDNDVVAVSGRAVKAGAGVGDAAGVLGSAYNLVNQNGGVMGMETHMYQNVVGMVAADSLGAKWSAGLHVLSNSTGSDARAGVAIDGSGSFRWWNAILIDHEAFRYGVGGISVTGTVGLNLSGANPQYGIKFGAAVGTAARHIYGAGAIIVEPTSEFQIIKSGATVGMKIDAGAAAIAYFDLKLNDVLKGNIAINSGTSGTPLEINSASATHIEMGAGGGSVKVANYLRVGSVAAPTNVTAGDLTTVRLKVVDGAFGTGVDFSVTGDGALSGFLRVGSETAPTNTTAGDLTAVRIFSPTIYGSPTNAAGGDLTLASTSNATKGTVLIDDIVLSNTERSFRIGTSNLTDRPAIMEIGGTSSTATSNNAGLLVSTIFTGASNSQGLTAYPTFRPSAGPVSDFGFLGIAVFGPPSGVTISLGIGLFARNDYEDVAGVVTNGYTMWAASPTFLGAATLKPGTQIGLYVSNQGSSGITNSYGVFIEKPTASSNNYYMGFNTADATDPTGGGGAATGRLAIIVGGVARYLAYY